MGAFSEMLGEFTDLALVVYASLQQDSSHGILVLRLSYTYRFEPQPDAGYADSRISKRIREYAEQMITSARQQVPILACLSLRLYRADQYY